MVRRLKNEGYAYFPGPDDFGHLIELLIHDKEGDAIYRDSYIQPTRSDIWDACKKYGLPHQEVIDIINKRGPDVHTIIIDVPAFMKNRGGKQ